MYEQVEKEVNATNSFKIQQFLSIWTIKFPGLMVLSIDIEEKRGEWTMMNCDSYLLDERALAIKPIFTGDYQSEIFTTHGIYYSKLKPTELLNLACINYLSTKKGRMHAATILLEYDKKPPFMISSNFGVLPTASPNNPNCIWIFSQRIKIQVITKTESVVTFMNGTSITVNASKHVIDKQNHRLHTLLSLSIVMDRERAFNLNARQN